MKRYLTLMVISILILGSGVTGCQGVQPKPQPPQTLNVSETKLPQAEASREDILTTGKHVVLGFYTDAGNKGSKATDSLTKYINKIDEVVFFWYSFDRTGKINLVDNVNMSIKEIAQKGGVKAYALVHNLKNQQFDPQLAHEVLANSTIRAKFVNNLVDLTMKENWDGITIDIEKVFSSDRKNYSAFLTELQTGLKAKDKILNVSIPAKYYDDPNDLWSGGFDYTAIGKAADQVVLMTYEEHGVGTTQGPIASQGWVKRVIDYATGQIPNEKIIMGLPVYASNWASNKPTLPTYFTYAQAKALAQKHNVSILYDESEQVPHFTYTFEGVRHEVFLENTRSLKAKLDYAKKNQLHGVGIWKLGIEDETLWTDVLRDYSSGHK